MSFSERAKLIALAIVHVFETSKPFGDYSAVAVLDDGAGISYGINQFTHKAGSLAAVVERFLKLGGQAAVVIHESLPDLKAGRHILGLSNNKTLRQELARLGGDPLMQQAQREIGFEKYLKPALEACDGSDFTLPLSLAVIYDSMNHGSYAKIRDRVQLELPASIKPIEYEKEWITQYVRKRDAWLESIPRLAKTDYRTDFFLAQIARGNWNLDLPLNVHGVKLTKKMFQDSAVPSVSATTSSATSRLSGESNRVTESSPDPEPPSTSKETETKIEPTPAGGVVETKTETVNTDTLKQYIPKIVGAKRWFGTLSLGGLFSTTFATIAGLPPWAIFVLGMLTATVIIGFAFILIYYKKQVFGLVKQVVEINADPTSNNIELTADK